MSSVLIIVIVLIVLVVGIIGWGVGAYNGLVKLRNQVEQAWRQIDVELNRRYDLIPNLVETVKGYASHESQTLERVIAMRNNAYQSAQAGASGEQRAAAENQLTGVLHQLIATAEAYPELRADAGFRQLASQLEETEDRIANGRRYYNAVVSSYNTKIQSFPNNILANMGGFKEAGYFEVRDTNVRQAPTVDFGNRSVQDHAVTDESRNSGELPSYTGQDRSTMSKEQGFSFPGANSSPVIDQGTNPQTGYSADQFGSQAPAPDPVEYKQPPASGTNPYGQVDPEK